MVKQRAKTDSFSLWFSVMGGPTLNSHCDQTKETGLGVQQTLNIYMEASSLRRVLGRSQDLGLGSE